MSIKPRFAQLILAEEKLFEFRKTRVSGETVAVLIYSSTPVQRFVGIAGVDEIIEGSPNHLWKIAGSRGGITRSEFLGYFDGKPKGFAIKLKSVHEFSKAVDPKTMISNFRAPQSFKYVDMDMLQKIFRSIPAAVG